MLITFLQKFKLENIISLFVGIMFVSCSTGAIKYSKKLEFALNQAGPNRLDLENVLEYYLTISPDSLKYQAACFLIENMPYHFSYVDTSDLAKYYKEIEIELSSDNENSKSENYELLGEKYKNLYLQGQPDILCVPGDYIIRNIEQSFNAWQTSKCAKHITFEDFCEYILPYKVTEFQLLDNWKDEFSTFGNDFTIYLEYYDMFTSSAYMHCEAVINEIRKKANIYVYQAPELPVKRIRTLFHLPYGSCDDYCHLGLAVMRAKGIPCSMEYTPQWPFRSLGHSWCTVLNNFGKHTIFDLTEEKPGYPHKMDHKFAKIYRKTFAANDELLEIHRKDKYVPKEFNEVCFKDITDEYMTTIDIPVKLSNYKDNQYAYLAVFNNWEWIPIYWGKTENGKAIFTKMGKDVVYLPVCYDASGMYNVGDPVLVNSKGDIFTLTPDTTNVQLLELSRKFPYLHHPLGNIMRMVGGKIQGSDNIEFKECEDFYTITNPSVKMNEIDINPNNESYRYWRYLSPANSFANIAELAFFSKESNTSIIGKIIGTDGYWGNESTRTKEAVFDNDPLTFFDAPNEDGGWVGMDFGKDIVINRVKYLARGDGNIIEIGHNYELFYWGNNWKSLGKKIADSETLLYDNCPSNCLFLLRNYTKGKEERIFTYQDGKQVWW